MGTQRRALPLLGGPKGPAVVTGPAQRAYAGSSPGVKNARLLRGLAELQCA